MDLFIAIILALSAIFAALTLIGWLTAKARLDRVIPSPERRSIVKVVFSLIGGVIIGSYMWSEKRQAKQTLQLLFELELLLAQLDGLIGAALAQGDATKMLTSLDSLVEKLDDYETRAEFVMPALHDRLPLQDYQDLIQGTEMIVSGFDALQHPKDTENKNDDEDEDDNDNEAGSKLPIKRDVIPPSKIPPSKTENNQPSKTDNTPLITMQKGVEIARKKTRELINQRISK